MPVGELNRRLETLSAVMMIHQNIGANLELEEIGRILVDGLARLVPCEGCAILVLNDGKAEILAEKGFQIALRGREFTTDMPVVKHLVDTKQSLATGNIAQSPAASCVPPGCVMKSLICTPIIVHGEVKGIVHLDSQREDAFGAEDVGLVELLANEISLAMARSFQYSRVKALAVRDALTGCYNRGKFNEDIRSALSRCNRYNRPLSILMIDIDWFKAYNDYHGHPKGDALLKKITNMLSQTIRLCDTLYRYGGEEFAVILHETGTTGALLAATRIKNQIESCRFEGAADSQPGKQITISIGVSSYSRDGHSENDLVAAADHALYRAKQTGRNRVFAAIDA